MKAWVVTLKGKESIFVKEADHMVSFYSSII
ncbi:Uncharacterised protein [uncultured Clostridium sp.]|nr:Uncharacterised protein [uncultured Clostridium sp.]